MRPTAGWPGSTRFAKLSFCRAFAVSVTPWSIQRAPTPQKTPSSPSAAICRGALGFRARARRKQYSIVKQQPGGQPSQPTPKRAPKRARKKQN